MKALFTLGSAALFGCGAPTPPDPSAQSAVNTGAYGAYFFDFDAIDAYRTELGIVDVFGRDGEMKPGTQLLRDVLLDGWPKDLTDTAALHELGRIGYKRSKIPEGKLGEIAELFREKTLRDDAFAACVAEYRDILVFQKEGKVTGIAKICFGCFQNQITGSTANTEFFGQGGDYQRLKDVLVSAKNI